MKKLTLALLLVLFTLQVRADSWLQNSDFSDGNSHWVGEAKTPADFAPSDPFAKADPFYSKGMIIPLSGAMWKKVVQDFKGKSANGVLTITYKVSPDFAFSDKPDDYKNMPDKIHYDAWLAFDSDPQSFVIFFSDLESRHGKIFYVHPTVGSDEVQTMKVALRDITPFTQKTITLAFPPGKGAIVILGVDIEDP